MSKLDFNEVDLLNATWGGMKSVKQKTKKDATDLNALAKGTQAITKFLDLKLRVFKYSEKNPRALGRANVFLT